MITLPSYSPPICRFTVRGRSGTSRLMPGQFVFTSDLLLEIPFTPTRPPVKRRTVHLEGCVVVVVVLNGVVV